MKYLKICLMAAIASGLVSCAETTKQDNVTHDNDTMVIRENRTDAPVNTISTDTTRR